MIEKVIDVKNLSRIFGSGTSKVEAVKNISFQVSEGEIFGFLGPNGAGKTTTLNMLSTLLFPSSGTATIAGYDIREDPDMVRKNIGMVFQETTLDIDLTGLENLELHAILYGVDKTTKKLRIQEMLEIVQLTDKAEVFVKNYSGGMKRRLEIARGLLHYPKCLFLDEPTLGLDPQTRRSIWEQIKRLNEEYGITIILTTHYMEEADALCDRICIIDHGEIIAINTSEMMKEGLKGDTISVEFNNSSDLKQLEEKIKNFPGIHAIKRVESKVDLPKIPPAVSGKRIRTPLKKVPPNFEEIKMNSTKLNIVIEDGSENVAELIQIANDAGIKIKSLTIKQPSLEEVFIHYTGRSIREENGSKTGTIRGMIQRKIRGS